MLELSATLQDLLGADSPSGEAWAAFTREYSRLLLHVARSTCHDHDDAMDAYAFLLEKLSEDGCRRLRAYSVDPRSKFTTWLVVVARRICLDHRRSRFGRLRNNDSTSEREVLGVRRKLAALHGDADSVDAIEDESTSSATTHVEREELSAALTTLRADLSPGDRLLLSLRFDDGVSAAEIASVLGYPSHFHVYRRINSLLAEMKAKLEARGYDNVAL
jgi:RNA polymerase sigma factor (sigma-70 family)